MGDAANILAGGDGMGALTTDDSADAVDGGAFEVEDDEADEEEEEVQKKQVLHWGEEK